MKVVELFNISYKIGDKNILNDISFDISERDCFGLIGENGAGKSTLIDIILKDLKPTKGEVKIFDKKNYKFGNIGVLYDTFPLFPLLTVKENIHFFCLYAKTDFSKIRSLFFDSFQIEKIENSLVQKLSQGEKKRVSLLLTLIHNPKILVLDEPFANIDPTISESIWNILSENRTILYTSHDWEHVQKHSNKISFLYKGQQLEESKSPDEIINSLPSDQLIMFSYSAEILSKLQQLKCIYFEENNTIHVFEEKEKSVLKEISQWTNNFSVRNSNLKDGYHYYIFNHSKINL